MFKNKNLLSVLSLRKKKNNRDLRPGLRWVCSVGISYQYSFLCVCDRPFKCWIMKNTFYTKNINLDIKKKINCPGLKLENENEAYKNITPDTSF